jgi:hypothetical protein
MCDAGRVGGQAVKTADDEHRARPHRAKSPGVNEKLVAELHGLDRELMEGRQRKSPRRMQLYSQAGAR